MRMKKSTAFWLGSAIFLLLVTGQFFCTPAPEKPAEAENSGPKALTKDELLAKGAYIVRTGGCDDCHSPKIFTAMGPIPDSTRELSGHPAGSPLPPMDTKALKPGYWVLLGPDFTSFVGPFGMSYSANLTPDSATGIGAWTVENFINTLRKGKHLGEDGGRPLAPPMPWQVIGQKTDEDLTAIFTYLQSLPAISNRVPPPMTPDQVAKMK